MNEIDQENFKIKDPIQVTCDNINHPSHYKGKGIEVIDVIEGFELNFRLGNAVKYILRASKKGRYEEDINKAIWYLNRELQKEK